MEKKTQNNLQQNKSTSKDQVELKERIVKTAKERNNYKHPRQI